MEQRKIGELFKRKRTMKNLFKSIKTVAVAVMAFASCSTNFTEEVSFGEKVQFTVNAVAEDMTRTAFGEYNSTNKTYKTLWEDNEEVIKVAINATKDATSTKTTVSDDKSTASFEVRIETGEVSAPYTFAALSPASAAVSGVNASFKSWNIEFPTIQTPTANSCDPKAQILLGTSTTYETMPSSVDLSFKHLSAYAKFSFINLNLSNATVNSVVMESEKTIAYRHYYYLAGDNAGTFEDNGATKVITINTSSLENIWVGLAPTDVSNSKLTFTINTSAGTYKKEVTMPADRVFEAGKVSTFKVDMTGVELEGSVKYELLTNVANLTAGSKVIIAAAKANYAMSTNQKSSNRGAAAITKEGNYIVDPSSDVEIFTVEEGTEAGSYAFKGKDGYIYAASSSGNQLKTQGTLSANSSWKITIENADTKLVAQGTNSHNILQYNPNNGSPLFNCYASASTDREHVAIYYIPAENQEPDTTPAIIPAETAIEIPADEQYTDVALTLKNITEDVTVNWDTTTLSWINDAYVEDETLFISVSKNETKESRQVVFTLTANGATATVTLTQKGAVTEVSGITTVEEFLAAAEDDTIYTLKGTITSVANTTYGNFDLTDETGTVYIYGLCSPEGEQKYWAASGAKLGDDIVIKTVRTSFNNAPQGKNAIFVELTSPGTLPFWSFSKDALVFSAAAAEQTIAVSAYNLKEEIKVSSDNSHFTASYATGVLTIAAAENKTPDTINANITLSCGTLNKVIEVSQSGITTGGEVEVTVQATMESFGWADATTVSEAKLDDNVTVKFAKGKASTAPAYYTSGSAVRLYQNGATMTITANGKTIKSIELTFANNHYYIAANCGEFTAEAATRIWTGEATEILFTTTGTDKSHRAYISKIKVTYID